MLRKIQSTLGISQVPPPPMVFFEEFYGRIRVRGERVDRPDLPEPELQMPAMTMNQNESLQFG